MFTETPWLSSCGITLAEARRQWSSCARCPLSSSSAAIQAASAPSNSSLNSVPRSRVSGVPGSSRACTRASCSLPKDRRAPRPKSARSEGVSMSRQKASASPRTRAAGSGCWSSCRSNGRSRRAGSGVLSSVRSSAVVGAWRSHSVRRTSHRWRSARPAWGSAALTRAVRSQEPDIEAARRLGAWGPRVSAACQCSALGCTSTNSATGDSKEWACSLMQKKVPLMLP